MAWLAERHQVRLVMRTAATQRQDVMDLCRFGQPAFLPALFAQRMCRKEPGAYPFPFTACVQFPCRLVAAVPVVLLVRLFLMFLAVPAVRQFRATGVAARSLGFPRHPYHLRHRKNPRKIPSPAGHSILSFFLILTISQVNSAILLQSVQTFYNYFMFPFTPHVS